MICFLFVKNLILNLSEVADAKFSHKLSTFTTLPKYYTPLDKRSLIVPFLWKFLPCSHLTLRRVPENYEIKIGDTDGSSWIYWCKMSTFSFRPPTYWCKIPAIFLSSKNKYFLADEDWNMATIAHPQVHKTRTKKVCTALWILKLKKFWKRREGVRTSGNRSENVSATLYYYAIIVLCRKMMFGSRATLWV